MVKQPSKEPIVKPFNFEPIVPVAPVVPITPSISSGASNSSLIVRKKYESCKNFREKGACKYGDRCLFAHGDHELTKRGSDEEEKPKPVVAPLEVVAEATFESTKDETVPQVS